MLCGVRCVLCTVCVMYSVWCSEVCELCVVCGCVAASDFETWAKTDANTRVGTFDASTECCELTLVDVRVR